jgi:redox-sensitive bicupin YhaK (pirin superfamily)
VSGPVGAADLSAPPVPSSPLAAPGGGDRPIEVSPDRETRLGDVPVRRALPRRGRRTIGAWCFVDHLGPMAVTGSSGVAIGPHPHMGLQTVTWLVRGEQLHTDSLGTEQMIRPGQLNVMSAGAGVAHAEDTGPFAGPLHGVQLWVAQPEDTRHGSAAFEHHPALPQLQAGTATVTVLNGTFASTRSPARTDTDLVGVDLDMHPGRCVLPLDPTFEHGLVVLVGALVVERPHDDQPTTVVPGSLAYLPPGPTELRLRTTVDTRALLIGGVPFPDAVFMWWNFVARTPDEVDLATEAWRAGSDRFGPVASPLARIPAPPGPGALRG